VASADNHFADMYGAGSAAGGSVLGGVQGTAAFLLGRKPPDPDALPKPHQWSLLADGSAHFVGVHEGEELKQWSAAVGLRRTIGPHHPTYLPFAHALIGVLHRDRGRLDGLRATLVLGGGLDYLTKPRGRKRGEVYTVLGARTQMELVVPVSGDSHHAFPRFSLGVVVRIRDRFFDE
jgi:hypothetical protein